MVVEGLAIPELLESMLIESRWPRTAAEALKQNLHSRVAEDRIRRLRGIYLYAPPFHTVAQIIAGAGKDFYSRYGALHELAPDAAIEIGDFGLGSDSPILLDYRAGPKNPRVIHLEWGIKRNPNRWVSLAPSLEDFVDMLGL